MLNDRQLRKNESGNRPSWKSKPVTDGDGEPAFFPERGNRHVLMLAVVSLAESHLRVSDFFFAFTQVLSTRQYEP